MLYRYKVVLKTLLWRAAIALLVLLLLVLLIVWCARRPEIPRLPVSRADVEHAVRSNSVILIANVRSQSGGISGESDAPAAYVLDVEERLLGNTARRITAMRYDNPAEYRLLNGQQYLLVLHQAVIGDAIEYTLHRFEPLDKRRTQLVQEWIAEFTPSRRTSPQSN